MHKSYSSAPIDPGRYAGQVAVCALAPQFSYLGMRHCAFCLFVALGGFILFTAVLPNALATS